MWAKFIALRCKLLSELESLNSKCGRHEHRATPGEQRAASVPERDRCSCSKEISELLTESVQRCPPACRRQTGMEVKLQDFPPIATNGDEQLPGTEHRSSNSLLVSVLLATSFKIAAIQNIRGVWFQFGKTAVRIFRSDESAVRMHREKDPRSIIHRICRFGLTNFFNYQLHNDAFFELLELHGVERWIGDGMQRMWSICSTITAF